jgi:hypothetical protein
LREKVARNARRMRGSSTPKLDSSMADGTARAMESATLRPAIS